MKKQIKVLQTPIRFFPYIGGVENHVLYLSKQLVKNGNSVTVICADEPKSKKRTVEGISIDRLPYIGKVTNTNIALSLPLKILSSKFDLIHTHMPTPWTADWSVFLAKIKGKKSVITIHNDMDKTSPISRLVTKLYLNTVFKFTLNLVNRIIIVNPDWKQSFIATRHLLLPHEKKITVIPNGVELSKFVKNNKERRDKNTILFVSILDKHHKFKGLDYLLEALALLKQTNSNIKLIVVGDGELRKFYELKAKTLQIDKNITFIGKASQEKLVEYYRKASIFVLPSIEIEGFGIVLLEAMASNLPVITTPIAGVWKDVKKFNSGLIVKPRNSKSLANALTQLLNDPTKRQRMGKNGSRLIKQKYDWVLVTSQVEKLYREVLQ